MKILDHIDLEKYTTIRIGGTADFMYVPENTEELMKIISEYSPLSVIGGGE